jgi:hypothetical protein
MIAHDKCQPLEQKIIDLERELELAIKVLKFYADRENWMFAYHLSGGMNYREIINTDTYGFKHPDTGMSQYYGGMRARKALKELGV